MKKNVNCAVYKIFKIHTRDYFEKGMRKSTHGHKATITSQLLMSISSVFPRAQLGNKDTQTDEVHC